MPSVFYEQRLENLFIGPICDHPFPSHVHDPAEVVCLTEGEIEMIIGSEKYRFSKGDIIIAFPSVPHSYEYVSPDANGLTLIFLPETISEFSSSFRTKQPVCPLLKSEDKPSEMDDVIRHLKELSLQEDSPLTLGYLHLFLAYLFSLLTLQPIAAGMQSRMSYHALHYISEHFTEPLSLESTAHALGISRIHLSHIFSQQLHINFRDYINTLRIDRACSLLRDPFYSISQIAYLCGYGNPRTFHRAFLAKRGMAPNRFRALLFEQEITE
ncbi:MAG: helix-turn-helix domain-containing protein [Clostridia bacterium]|nr:helix-turn-helix domain-containing protein [Clostridia bacterium]